MKLSCISFGISLHPTSSLLLFVLFTQNYRGAEVTRWLFFDKVWLWIHMLMLSKLSTNPLTQIAVLRYCVTRAHDFMLWTVILYLRLEVHYLAENIYSGLLKRAFAQGAVGLMVNAWSNASDSSIRLSISMLRPQRPYSISFSVMMFL